MVEVFYKLLLSNVVATSNYLVAVEHLKWGWCFWGTEFLNLFIYFLTMPRGMWDLSSLTSNETCGCCGGNSLNTRHVAYPVGQDTFSLLIHEKVVFADRVENL